jgi:hypothetical protein
VGRSDTRNLDTSLLRLALQCCTLKVAFRGDLASDCFLADLRRDLAVNFTFDLRVDFAFNLAVNFAFDLESLNLTLQKC